MEVATVGEGKLESTGVTLSKANEGIVVGEG